ncbi:MAG: branched-chain amino acid ABC transporter permease [Clostridia bacterium]|nr:branched-chain amino acid ABC transporter permease [Clostridia bacterium]
MNKFLSNKYAFLGQSVIKRKVSAGDIRHTLLKPQMQFIIFGVLMCVVGYLSTELRVLPYSWQSALATTFSFSIAAVGFCLLMGYSGLASLATGGFIGIGTYSVHFVMAESGLPLTVAIIVALLIAVVIGAIVGFISLRIEGIYLVILTLGLSEILRNVFMAVETKITLTSSEALIFGMKLPRASVIYVVMAALVVVMLITHNLINSPTGRAMLAMKNSTAAAQAMGISLIKYRLLAFVISTAFAALAGVMYMIVVRSADSTDGMGAYALITSLNILAAVIIGGYKSIWGAIFGTFVMYGMQTTIFNKIEFFAENPVIITFVSGILVILIVMFYPGGIAQLFAGLKVKVKKLISKLKEARYGKDLG